MHLNCQCNEYLALRNRVVMQVPIPTREALQPLYQVAKAIAEWVGPATPDREHTWLEAYHSRKKRRYQDALNSLSQVPYNRRDSYLSTFVKPEKIPDTSRAPRAIQARSARYNACLADYLKPIEHKLYNIKGTRRLTKLLPNTRVIAKGLNQIQRARLLQKKWDKFKKPKCCVMDASRFDAHVTGTLDVEHCIYRSIYKNDKFLNQLLKHQVINKGFTKNGIKYTTHQGRMSGDMNTALGNCLISIIMAAAYMRRKTRHWELLVDGDDTLIITEDCVDMSDVADVYKTYGFTMKVETVNQFHDITFCQSKPIDTIMGPKMCMVPERTIMRCLCGCRHWDNSSFVTKYLGLIGTCELALAMGVPILQEWALAVMRAGEGKLPDKEIGSGRLIKCRRELRTIREIRPLPITPEARATFDLAFDINAECQLIWEAAFRTLDLRHGKPMELQLLPERETISPWSISRAWSYVT